MKSQDNRTIRPYLLGLLNQAEQEQTEKQLLTDDDFYEELLIEENELIDDYLAGALSSSDQQSFENHFLSTNERQKKVRFGKAFKRYATDNVVAVPLVPRRWSFLPNFFPTRSPLAATALAAVLLVFVAGVSWIVLRNQSQNPAGQNFATAVLTPGTSRAGAGEITRISLTPDKDGVQLRLALPAGDYQKYRAEINSAQGTRVWTSADLSPQQPAEERLIVLNVPANVLSRDDYQVRLSGQIADSSFEDVASYTFRVSR